MDESLRHAGQKRSVDRADFRTLSRGREKLVQVVTEERDVLAGAVLEDKLKTTGSAYAGDRGGREAESGSGGHLGEFAIQTILDGLILLVSGFAIVPRFESDEEEGIVRRRRQAQQVESDDGRGVFDARSIGENLLDFRTGLARAFHR